MTKADIVNEVAKATGLEKLNVQKVVEAFMETVKDSVSKDNSVYLRGFGSFALSVRPPRIGRNPRSGEKVHVEAKRVPHFKPGKELRQRVDSAAKAD